MEENQDHFLCGVCKAGFRSGSFLQFLEHIVRHLSVSKNNKCFICHKGFSRTQSLKDHLLHFHAIPLKIDQESYYETENANKSLLNGSARCHYYTKKAIKNNKSFSSCATNQANVSPLQQVQSKITLFENTENSNSSIDVLTVNDGGSNPTSNLMLLPEHNDNFNKSYNEVALLPFETSSKDINPGLFLIDPSGSDMNFDGTFTKGLSSEKIKGCENETALNMQSDGKDIQRNRVLSDDQTKVNGQSKAVTIDTKINNRQNSNDCHFDTETGAFDFKKTENTVNSLSTKINPSPRNRQVIITSENVGLVNNGDPNGIPLKDTILTKRDKSNLNKNQLMTKINEESIDFHFFLGSTVINGTSMTYNRIEFRCLHCSFVCAWRPSLIKHMKQIHKEALDFHKILDIKIVQSNSLIDDKLNKYKVMKLSDYLLLNCKVRKRRKAPRSIERQDIPGKYSCPICNKVFRRIRYMRRHQLSHGTERSHLCDTCGKSFKTRASLLAHHRSHKSRSYHCPQCEFVSNLSGAIHRHRQIHPNGSVICDICGAAYIDKSTLKKHRRVHDISRPFACTFPACTWRFKTENMKKAHLQSHTIEGKFRCLQCGYRFRHKHHLQRHLSRVHAQTNPPSKLHSNSYLPSNLHVESDIAGSTGLLQHRFHSQGVIINDSTNPAFSPTRHSSNQHEILLSPSGENILPTSDPRMELKLPQTSVDIFVGDKPPEGPVSVNVDKSFELSVSAGLDNNFENINSNSNHLSNLEYVTENGDIIQLVKPSQIYMRPDQCGNMVEYRITDIQAPNHENQSQSVFIIGSDGTLLGTSSQDQTLLLP